MGNLHQINQVVGCINALYHTEEIDSQEKTEMLSMAKEAFKNGDWSKVKNRLLAMRSNSLSKKKIDFAINAMREN